MKHFDAFHRIRQLLLTGKIYKIQKQNKKKKTGVGNMAPEVKVTAASHRVLS